MSEEKLKLRIKVLEDTIDTMQRKRNEKDANYEQKLDARDVEIFNLKEERKSLCEKIHFLKETIKNLVKIVEKI